MTTAVEGLRVLEVSVGMALAEKGAEVIKVKPPTGDALRGNPGFLAWRLGKKSVTLDLKIPVGVANFKGLIRTVDAVIEDMAPGVAVRLGIDCQRLRNVNSRLVYAAITGFGVTPPAPSWGTMLCGDVSDTRGRRGGWPWVRVSPSAWRCLASTSSATACETSSIPVCGVRDRSVSDARGQMTSSTT